MPSLATDLFAKLPALELEALTLSITDVSSIPSVVSRTMEVVNDAKSSAADLMHVVETDPSLSARLLRTVNSAAFSLSEPVYSIHRAICLLGFNQVKSLAVSLSVADIFRDSEALGPYTRKGLWRHLVAVGAVAKMTAQRVGMANYEEAFVAGLLHDFGIILLDQYAHAHFARVLLRASEEQRPFVEVERETLGFDHSDLGVAIAKRWRFPASILAAIEFHHRSRQAPQEFSQLTSCVELANCICTRKNYPSVGLKCLPAPSAAALAAIKIKREGLAVLIENVDESIAKYNVMMNPWSESSRG